MKHILVALFAAFIGFGMLPLDAEAKRLGGGVSSGMKRDSSVMQRQAAPAPTQSAAVPAKPAPAAAPAPAAPQPSGMSRWLGPIAGIAAGIGLAALLSHFGMGEGVANFLMIALLVFAAIFVVRMLFARRQPQPAMQYAGGAPERFEPVRMPAGGSAAPAGEAASVPAGFDVEGFLRQAKLNFVRLQAANDAGNLDDIRQFTTPEMYAEIKLQHGERAAAAQTTDVVKLDAALLDFSTEDNRHVATVRFSGLISEEAGAPAQPFDEAWHLAKPVDGSGGWVIAGIQQFQ
jgi:predicted lipid-binding transport protein (Tim44 family)